MQRKIIVCGPPHSGKSVFLASLMRQLPPDSFYLAFAAPDGEWHWSNYGDQDLVKVVRQKGKFSPDFVNNMIDVIRRNEQPLVLVDTGGVRSAENATIFEVCDGCIILSSKPEETVAWREFAREHGVRVIAELNSVLHGACELYADCSDGVIRGRISGLERGHIINSPVLEAVAELLREIIRENAEFTLAEMQAHINGAVLVQRLGVEDTHDPYLGVRPEYLRFALRLTSAARELELVRIWNVRASILASAYATSLPGQVELYDVKLGYVRLPEIVPQGEGDGVGAVEWEVIELPEFTVVRWRNLRFVTVDDLNRLVPPGVDTTKPVVLVNQEPPMWVHATLARAYSRAGCPWVGQFWPMESARPQPQLSGRRWDEVHPFAGPAVVVAGPEEKVGEVFPISFNLLQWDTPVISVSGDKIAHGS